MQKNKKFLTSHLSSPISQRSGFTMVEMLLVLAVISILAGAILVSVNSQRQKARQAKMLAELSGTLQPIMMCLSDNNRIITPSSGGNICENSAGTDLPNYGKWPTTGGTSGFNAYVSALGYSATPTAAAFNNNNWYFYTKDSTVSIVVCCNASSSKCGIVNAASCSNVTAL